MKLDFDQMVEQYHLALGELGKGNPEPLKELFSHRGDVSIAGGFGGVLRGWEQVATNTEFAASRFKDAQGTFENVVKFAAHDLGYIVEIERFEAKVGGGVGVANVVLRTTSIFRLEEGAWKLAHRHGDPVVSIQEAGSVIQKQDDTAFAERVSETKSAEKNAQDIYEKKPCEYCKPPCGNMGDSVEFTDGIHYVCPVGVQNWNEKHDNKIFPRSFMSSKRE